MQRAKTAHALLASRETSAAERGLMMPARKFMTEEDAATLWAWMHAVATKPLPPYAAPVAAAKR